MSARRIDRFSDEPQIRVETGASALPSWVAESEGLPPHARYVNEASRSRFSSRPKRSARSGPAFSMFPNGLRQLERIGLGEALAAVGAKIGDGSRYCRADGTGVGPIVRTNSMGWNGVYGMHRADLLNTLAGKLSPKKIRLGQCCTGIVQTASICAVAIRARR